MAIGQYVRRAKSGLPIYVNDEPDEVSPVLDGFAEFCAKQRERVSADLKRRTERIARAKWGDCEGDGSHFVVSRKGTTEVSGPLHRRYQEQT